MILTQALKKKKKMVTMVTSTDASHSKFKDFGNVPVYPEGSLLNNLSMNVIIPPKVNLAPKGF